MHVINTEISDVIVEIEGEQYPVAPKTIATADALMTAAQKCKGQLEYKLWLAELEVLLGKEAVRKLFFAGKAENIDRLERIHAGVFAAFDENHNSLTSEQTQAAADLIATSLSPVNELLRRLQALDNSEKKPIIHRDPR